MRIFTYFVLIVIILSCNTPKNENPTMDTDDKSFKVIGEIIKLDPRLGKVINTDAKIEVIAEGYKWSEGPLWIESEQMLIWSDVPENKIYSWKEGEKAKVYLQPSGYTGDSKYKREGANGLLLNSSGELILCQHGDRRMARMDAQVASPKPQYVTIADRYNGKRFNSPNDAVYDKDGVLYFTDPPYGLEKQDEDPNKEIPFNGVYRVSPKGEVELLTDELSRPNGIAFSPDYSKCYVANSDPEKAIWMVYEMNEDKSFKSGKVLFDATSMISEGKGLPDGMKVNKENIIFATGPGGVFIISPEGDHLGTIDPGFATANCAFNADESVLFMTAHMYVTKIRLK
jgi:gluconolactonase